jgi:sugar phosphate isomerase/epimerase
MTNPPILRQIASLWTLWDHPTPKKPWTLERQIAEIKAAGFDGFTTLADATHAKLAEKHGLLIVGHFAASKATEFRPLIQQNVDAGAVYINVQLGQHDTSVPAAIKLAVQLNEIAEKLGAKCSIESHRNTCTETPEKTYAVAAGYKKATGKLLPITWDFSHPAVVKHLEPPYDERLLIAPKLVQHAQQFHFRPFNGHHCQIPVTDGRGNLSVEFTQWVPLLEKTLEMWMAGKQAGRELFAVPELGPVRGGYNLAQLPSSWEDAKVLREIIAKTWRKTLSAPSRK